MTFCTVTPKISHRRLLLGLCGLWVFALSLRLVYLYEISDSPLWLVVMGDARSYDWWAKELAAGEWLGSEIFYQAPLYPYFLGGVYSLFGDGPWVTRIIQSVLGATASLCLAIAGIRLIAPRVGFLAGFLFAAYPPAIFFDGIIQKTTLTSFLLCLLFAIMARLASRPTSSLRWATAGATIGLLALVRENAIVLAFLAPIWMTIIRPNAYRNWIRWTVILFAGVAAILAPVAARNAYVGGEWHLTTSQFGPNFFIGNHAEAEGLYVPLLPDRGDPIFERFDAVSLAQEDSGHALTPREVSRYWTFEALEDIAANPWRWVRLEVRKLWLSFAAMEIIDTEDQYTYAEYSVVLTVLMAVWHMGVLVPLAAFGVSLAVCDRRWRKRLSWPAIVVIGYTVSLLLFYVFARYRFPLVPPLMLFAAFGIGQSLHVARIALYRRDLTRKRRSAIATSKKSRTVRYSVALSIAAITAVPANRYVYPIAMAQAVTRENLGEHLHAAGFETELVLAQYDRAVSLTPENSSLRISYAHLLWELAKPEEAISQLEAAVDASPQDPGPLVELGTMYRDLSEMGLSTDRLRSAVSVAPEAPEPTYHLAITLLKWADQISAEATSSAVDAPIISLASDSVYQAELTRAAELRTEAVAMLRQSIQQGPESEASHSALAHVLARLGESEEAAEEFAKAANLAPVGSERQARLLHLQRRMIANPKSRRGVPPLLRRK